MFIVFCQNDSIGEYSTLPEDQMIQCINCDKAQNDDETRPSETIYNSNNASSQKFNQ